LGSRFPSVRVTFLGGGGDGRTTLWFATVGHRGTFHALHVHRSTPVRLLEIAESSPSAPSRNAGNKATSAGAGREKKTADGRRGPGSGASGVRQVAYTLHVAASPPGGRRALPASPATGVAAAARLSACPSVGVGSLPGTVLDALADRLEIRDRNITHVARVSR